MNLKNVWYFISLIGLVTLSVFLTGCPSLTSCQDTAGPYCLFDSAITRTCCIAYRRRVCAAERWYSPITRRYYYRNVWIASCVSYYGNCRPIVNHCP